MARVLSRLKAPFPWFGGKSRIAHLVWPRFGNVVNYVEPFAGSLAILLGRPEKWPARNETVNDLDCHIANFWRAIQADPEAVAAAADWPVNEADLHARHQWLHEQEGFRELMHSDPHHYNAQIAGWWVWGISCWIGDNWCRPDIQRSRPDLKRTGGVHAIRGDGTGLDRRRPNISSGNGIHSGHLKRPQLGKGGRGVHRQIPDVSGNDGASGRGIHAGSVKKMPDISGRHGACGRGVHAGYCQGIYEYMARLAARLRDVRVCCGDWSRVLGPSPTTHIGVTAVFLDPPYGVEDRDKVYGHDSLEVASSVREWCAEHGSDPKLRIALCGYGGEHDELEALGWDCMAWKANGGYGSRGKRKLNAERERIWFSPACLRDELPLFREAGDA